MADDLDAIVDTLYAADLDAFTRLRDEAAKRLRSDGDKEAADELKALRKPPVSVWAINRLARTARKDVDALLDAGHKLREAQGTLLAGGEPDDFERARRAHVAAVDRLVGRAERLLQAERDTAPAALLDRIRATLQSASVGDEGRALLARGRLTEELAPSGFDALGEVGPLPAAPKSRAGGTERRARIRELEARLRKARDAAREAADAAHAAEGEARRARQEADARARDAEAARKRADAAAVTVEELEADLRAAKSSS
jgi:hypothetical protein